MSDVKETRRRVLLAYGLAAGGARLVLPAVFDLPFVRAVRGSMFDRLAHNAGIALTAEAKRVLVDLEEPTTSRGALEQTARWIAGRMLRGAIALDIVRGTLATFGAGALFQNYLKNHRLHPNDPVLSAFEAEQIRQAMRPALSILSVEHIRALTRAIVESAHDPERERPGSIPPTDRSIVRRYGNLAARVVVGLPNSWIKAIDQSFTQGLNGQSPSTPPDPVPSPA